SSLRAAGRVGRSGSSPAARSGSPPSTPIALPAPTTLNKKVNPLEADQNLVPAILLELERCDEDLQTLSHVIT
ncbi:unnamed protein product, partial [Amoebophrya sp. A25]